MISFIVDQNLTSNCARTLRVVLFACLATWLCTTPSVSAQDEKDSKSSPNQQEPDESKSGEQKKAKPFSVKVARGGAIEFTVSGTWEKVTP